jgi:hypothetical protein
MITLATLVPGLPVDLAHLVLEYAPGAALLALPAHERIEVVRRLTGLRMSDERASLILEQRELDNRDFEDLAWIHDEKAWNEALRTAYSPRSFDELTRIGQIKVLSPSSNDFAFHSYLEQGDHGVALARYLEHASPANDLLRIPMLLHEFAHEVTYPPTVQYILRRLLDTNDPSFEANRRYCTSLGAFAQLCFGNTPSPLEVLVFRFCKGILLWHDAERIQVTSMPLLAELISAHPTTRTLLLHYNVLHMMFYQGGTPGRFGVTDLTTGIRPPGVFTFDWTTSPMSFSYGSLTRTWHDSFADIEPFCKWLIQDWLALAHTTHSWTGFADMLRCCMMHDPSRLGGVGKHHVHLLAELVQGVPDEVLIDQFTRQPTLLSSFYWWPPTSSVPFRLLTVVPFQAWLEGFKDMRHKTDCNALRFFSPSQRVLLRES